MENILIYIKFCFYFNAPYEPGSASRKLNYIVEMSL